MQQAPAEIRGNDLIIHLDRPLNLDHIETVAGQTDQFQVEFEVADTRRIRPRQRRLFFALVNDIITQFDVPREFVKDLFYTLYSVHTDGKEISLADDSKCSVSDGNVLLGLVVDFMFEWHVEWKQGYELLPRDQEYFQFQCCRHRECVVCSEYADIHHVDTVKAGNNRTKIDHTKRHVMALCRKHHSEIEQIGPKAFSRKYHTPVNGIKLDVTTLKELGVRGDYSDSDDNAGRKTTD